jgi:hypothetical protein
MSKSDAGFTAAQIGSLPGLLGFGWIEVRAGFARGRFDIGNEHLALNDICMRRRSSRWPIRHAVTVA